MSDLYAQSLNQSPREIERALGDFLTVKTSFRREDLDPVALDLVRQEATLLDCAAAINRVPPSTKGHELARNLTVGDFPGAFVDGLAKPLVAGYANATEHEAIVWDQPTPNFRPVQLPTVDVGELAGPERGYAPELGKLIEGSSGATGRPFTWVGRLLISREVLIGDDMGLIVGTMEALGQAGAAVEAKLIAQVLEANELADGATLFVGDNTQTGGLDVAGLNSAFNALRTQTTPAWRTANLAPAVLLVPPDEIATALVLNQSMGNPLKVISNAYLASGTRYVFADPALSRCLVRLRLERSQRAGPKVFRVNVPDYDGIGIEILHDVGIVAVNRIGVVRLADA